VFPSVLPTVIWSELTAPKKRKPTMRKKNPDHPPASQKLDLKTKEVFLTLVGSAIEFRHAGEEHVFKIRRYRLEPISGILIGVNV